MNDLCDCGKPDGDGHVCNATLMLDVAMFGMAVSRVSPDGRVHRESPEEFNGAHSRTSPDGSVTVTVPCDETSGELP